MKGLLLCTLLLASLSLVAEEPVLVCVDDAGFPPYAYLDPKSPGLLVGASVEQVEAVLEGTGHRLRIELLPWKRCLEEVEAGTISPSPMSRYSRASSILASST